MASAISFTASSSSTPSIPRTTNYDVFLSFRGEDTRYNFTDHLDSALGRRGIRTFRDDKLRRGEAIAPELLKAIEESRSCVIVFSENYARSRWCLDELVKIMECHKDLGHAVIPIFYHVDPSHVRKQEGSFGEAFAGYEENWKDKIPRWRAALTEAANLSGWHLLDGYESDQIKAIVGSIFRLLNCKRFDVGANLVGIDSHVKEMILRLHMESSDVRIVGIYGVGGIGKTTIAKVIYNNLSCEFECMSFLENIREISNTRGLPYLQNQLLGDLLGEKRNQNMISVYHGATMIKAILSTRRVFIVLDDVDDLDQLKYLLGNRGWLGHGSRVIITSREKHLLNVQEVDDLYAIEGLNPEEAYELFSLYAFKQNHPKSDFINLSHRVIRYCQGLPLSLKVLGSLLFNKTIPQWEIALHKLERGLEEKIHKVLKIYYDGLNRIEENTFLDIPCFKNLNDKGHKHVLMPYLIKHDIRKIVPDEPNKWSRLWDPRDIEDVLSTYEGIKGVETRALTNVFANMKKLKLLEVCHSDAGMDDPKAYAYFGVGMDDPKADAYFGVGMDDPKAVTPVNVDLSTLRLHSRPYEKGRIPRDEPTSDIIMGPIPPRRITSVDPESGVTNYSKHLLQGSSKFRASAENFQTASLSRHTGGEPYEGKCEVGYQSIKQKMEELNRMKDIVCLFLSYPMNMVNKGIHESWVLHVLKINRKVRKIEAPSKKEKIISPYTSKLYSEIIALLGHSMDDIEAYVPHEIIEKMRQKTMGVDKTTTIHAEVQTPSDSEEEQGKKATIHREGEILSDSDVEQGKKTAIHRESGTLSDSEVEQGWKTTIHRESQILSDSEVDQSKKATIHRMSEALSDSEVDQSKKATIHRKSEALSDSEVEEVEKASSQHDDRIPVPDDILDLAVEFAIRQILKDIENPEVQITGISGRQGIRVTSELKNLQQIRRMFDVVVQVPVFADSTINDVEKNISVQLGVSVFNREKLCRLLKDTNFLILLDYMHENINLSQLGTNWWNSKNIQKIVSTTKLQKVHHRMAIDLEIRMEDHLLPWELFCMNVGKVVPSSQIQGAAIDVVNRCCCHLLAIVLMGRALKEVNDVSIWKHASHALCLFPTSQMKDSILFNALAFICKQLGSKKRCVKHCALNMDKEGMDKVHLIQRWIKDGLIGTVDEGEVIVEDLLKAFLLESSQNGVSVGMRDEIREELGNLFAPVLNLGGEGLTMPPNDVSWEEADEIHLMNNELSELPYSPNCPQLRVLLLQANPFLTVIPHLFFEHMPSLQILDLSHTRIKFLPKSLLKLVKLRNFFLRSCELFMKVPPEVGELGNLEVLDFEGTEIISLPMDVGKLSKLMCLKLSFYGEDEDEGKNNRSTTIIPQNAIGKLLQLEELSIDVNPDDERWNEMVKNILKEVCSLKGLKVLKLYLPEVVLLNEFKQSEISFRSLSRFSFIVGGHLKRIISRLPRETTFEFKKQKRCLKYVNGEDIPVEIKEVLQHATALFLDRHLTLTKLSEFGIENMKELEVCVLGECKEIQTLVDGAEINKQEDNAGDVNEQTVLGSLRYLSIHYMKNLRSIWEGPVQKGCLSSLKSLALHTCPQLTTIFTLDLLENLNFLEALVIENCPKINSLVTHELPAEEIQLCSIVHLPKLKKISLHYMHELVSISSGLHIAPKVEWMSFYGCPNLKTLSPMDVSSSNLKGIIGEVDWWNELTWNVQKENLDSIFVPIKGVTELKNQIAEIGDQLQH